MNVFPFLKCKTLEARGGIEPPIKALQAFALPLGDRAAELVSLQRRNQILRPTKQNPPAIHSGGGCVKPLS
jgi:hypothetical protein